MLSGVKASYIFSAKVEKLKNHDRSSRQEVGR
jgi:hypothetical protein